MGKAGEARKRGDDVIGADSGGAGDGEGRGRVLPVVGSGKRLGGGERGDARVPAVGVVIEFAVEHIDPAGHRAVGRDGDDPAIVPGFEEGADLPAVAVVDADDGDAVGVAAIEDPALGGDVTIHGAVTVDVVGRDVDQHRDVEHVREDELELIGGEFEDIGARGAERIERQHRRPEIAADRRLLAGGFEDVADQRRDRGLAVGAGDADEPGAGLGPRHELDVADDLEPAGARLRRDRMGFRMGVGNPGTEHEGRDGGEIGFVEIGDRHLGRHRRLALVPVVVPRQHTGAAGDQRPRRGKSRVAEAEHGDLRARRAR